MGPLATTDPDLSATVLTDSSAAPAGAQILPHAPGRYVFDDPPVVIGRGGSGRVIEARDTVLDRVVAIKELLDSGAAGPVERLEQASFTDDREGAAQALERFASVIEAT